MLRRSAVAVYGTVAYAAFVISSLYGVGFLAGVGVPKAVDDGARLPAWQAVLIDAGLLGLFAVQHSVMARPGFKRRWTRVVAPSVERSTYVLAASVLLGLTLWLWRPLPEQLWSVHGWARAPLWSLYLAGWVVGVLSTVQIGHFDMFGLRQAYVRARQGRYEEPGFRQPLLYRLVRHPLMVGFLISFWAAPDMSVGRLLFVGLGTGYIMVGVRLEEHDQKSLLGEPYLRYLRQVPGFIPRLGTRPAVTGGR
jgi:protein-S-isoprenylcysteine O-methyltransferase Ste14